jgi:hypothetical protein
MNILFRAYRYVLEKENWPKIYIGQDPDPDIFESRIRLRPNTIRIRSKTFWILNTECKLSTSHFVSKKGFTGDLPRYVLALSSDLPSSSAIQDLQDCLEMHKNVNNKKGTEKKCTKRS